MTLPSKETLIFFNEIDPWIVNGKRENGVTYIFSKDTPKEKLELFNKIKDKLGYKVNDYILEDQNQYYISVYLLCTKVRDVTTRKHKPNAQDVKYEVYYGMGVSKMMYLPKELFRNKDNEEEVRRIISNLELDLKTDKSLTTDKAISMLEELGEDLIIKELDLMKKDG